MKISHEQEEINFYSGVNPLPLRFSADISFLRRPGLIVALAALILLMLGVFFYTVQLESMLHTLSYSIGESLSPFGQYAAPAFPLINTAFYLIGAVALFLISREFIFADRYTYFVVSSYLIYFPLAGFNWTTFTPISLFPTLFLLGFYFYIIERRAAALVIFLAAALTFQVFSIIVILSALAIFSRDKKSGTLVRENYMALTMVFFSLLMLISADLHSGLMGYYTTIDPKGYSLLLPFTQTITHAKPLFFIVLLVPLITYGFFGPRVLPVTIPYYVFGIITTIAGGSPETLVAILDLALPLAFLGTIRWIGRKVEIGIPADDTRIIRFALFSLILLNIMVILTYFPFLSILGGFLGL